MTLTPHASQSYIQNFVAAPTSMGVRLTLAIDGAPEES